MKGMPYAHAHQGQGQQGKVEVARFFQIHLGAAKKNTAAGKSDFKSIVGARDSDALGPAADNTIRVVADDQFV
jgi:hypothetical protein